MTMAVMCVRIVWMFVRHPLMSVPVSVARVRRYGIGMGMLMMGIVRVLMFVLDRHMRMLVIVLLGEVQPYAQCHQNARGDERQRYGFAQ